MVEQLRTNIERQSRLETTTLQLEEELLISKNICEQIRILFVDADYADTDCQTEMRETEHKGELFIKIYLLLINSLKEKFMFLPENPIR